MPADAMLEKGDLDGYAVWKRILRAVGELPRTVPGHGSIEARSRGWIFLMYRNSNVGSGETGSHSPSGGCAPNGKS